MVKSAEDFLVQIIDRCDPHPDNYSPLPTISTPDYLDQEMYITIESTYPSPPFTVDPDYCTNRMVITYDGADPTTVGA